MSCRPTVTCRFLAMPSFMNHRQHCSLCFCNLPRQFHSATLIDGPITLSDSCLQYIITYQVWSMESIFWKYSPSTDLIIISSIHFLARDDVPYRAKLSLGEMKRPYFYVTSTLTVKLIYNSCIKIWINN